MMIFDSLMNVRPEDIEPFAGHWCGPSRFVHGEKALVAVYHAAPESDGQTVEVFCSALPARFYTIRVLGGANSVGERMGPWGLQTGSGMAKTAAELARDISDGMIGRVDDENKS